MILLMLSGGLDSTCALYKILKEMKDPVHAHFVDYRTIAHRHMAETRAVTRIVPWLQRNVRPFKFTSSIQDYSKIEGCPVDLHMYCYTAAQIVRITMSPGPHPSHPIKAVATGLIRTDRANRGGLGGDRLPPSSQWEARRKVAEAIFAACLSDFPSIPTWMFPCFDMTKVDELLAIPRELSEMTWSCRMPVSVGEEFTTCEACHACHELAEAKLAAAATTQC